MPGSFFSLDRHSGFFLANLRSFLCLAAEAFWILLRRRVVVRLDFGSAPWLAGRGKVMGQPRIESESDFRLRDCCSG